MQRLELHAYNFGYNYSDNGELNYFPKLSIKIKLVACKCSRICVWQQFSFENPSSEFNNFSEFNKRVSLINVRFVASCASF